MFITTAWQGPDGVPPVAEPLMTTPLVCATRFGRTQNSTLSRATHKSCNAVSARRCASARFIIIAASLCASRCDDPCKCRDRRLAGSESESESEKARDNSCGSSDSCARARRTNVTRGSAPQQLRLAVAVTVDVLQRLWVDLCHESEIGLVNVIPAENRLAVLRDRPRQLIAHDRILIETVRPPKRCILERRENLPPNLIGIPALRRAEI